MIDIRSLEQANVCPARPVDEQDFDGSGFTNVMRAEDARDAVAGAARMDHENEEDEVTDFLANLMHLCRMGKIDFHRCLQSAQMHHDAEKEGLL